MYSERKIAMLKSLISVILLLVPLGVKATKSDQQHAFLGETRYGWEDKLDNFGAGDFVMHKGSLKDGLDHLIGKIGWKMVWNLNVDYELTAEIMAKQETAPEFINRVIQNIPMRMTFYTENRVAVVTPMYDREKNE